MSLSWITPEMIGDVPVDRVFSEPIGLGLYPVSQDGLDVKRSGALVLNIRYLDPGKDGAVENRPPSRRPK